MSTFVGLHPWWCEELCRRLDAAALRAREAAQRCRRAAVLGGGAGGGTGPGSVAGRCEHLADTLEQLAATLRTRADALLHGVPLAVPTALASWGDGLAALARTHPAEVGRALERRLAAHGLTPAGAVLALAGGSTPSAGVAALGSLAARVAAARPGPPVEVEVREVRLAGRGSLKGLAGGGHDVFTVRTFADGTRLLEHRRAVEAGVGAAGGSSVLVRTPSGSVGTGSSAAGEVTAGVQTVTTYRLSPADDPAAVMAAVMARQAVGAPLRALTTAASDALVAGLTAWAPEAEFARRAAASAPDAAAALGRLTPPGLVGTVIEWAAPVPPVQQAGAGVTATATGRALLGTTSDGGDGGATRNKDAPAPEAMADVGGTMGAALVGDGRGTVAVEARLTLDARMLADLTGLDDLPGAAQGWGPHLHAEVGAAATLRWEPGSPTVAVTLERHGPDGLVIHRADVRLPAVGDRLRALTDADALTAAPFPPEVIAPLLAGALAAPAQQLHPVEDREWGVAAAAGVGGGSIAARTRVWRATTAPAPRPGPPPVIDVVDRPRPKGPAPGRPARSSPAGHR